MKIKNYKKLLTLDSVYTHTPKGGIAVDITAIYEISPNYTLDDYLHTEGKAITHTDDFITNKPKTSYFYILELRIIFRDKPYKMHMLLYRAHKSEISTNRRWQYTTLVPEWVVRPTEHGTMQTIIDEAIVKNPGDLLNRMKNSIALIFPSHISYERNNF